MKSKSEFIKKRYYKNSALGISMAVLIVWTLIAIPYVVTHLFEGAEWTAFGVAFVPVLAAGWFVPATINEYQRKKTGELPDEKEVYWCFGAAIIVGLPVGALCIAFEVSPWILFLLGFSAGAFALYSHYRK
jgi:hypothetical protein